MKTTYEKIAREENKELQESAMSFVDRLRSSYSQLDAHRKALKDAKQKKTGVSNENRKSMCIDLKHEIKQTKQAIAQIRKEFQQWMNGLPTAA